MHGDGLKAIFPKATFLCGSKLTFFLKAQLKWKTKEKVVDRSLTLVISFYIWNSNHVMTYFEHCKNNFIFGCIHSAF